MKVLIVIKNFILGIFRFIFIMTIALLCWVIKTCGGEGDKEKILTPRKARRIRFLTKVKIFAYDIIPGFFKFIDSDGYMGNLKTRLYYGM